MRLDPRALAAVIDVCSLRYTTEGEVLLEQGQPGNFFFVVKEGTFALKVALIAINHVVYASYWSVSASLAVDCCYPSCSDSRTTDGCVLSVFCWYQACA